MLVTLSLSVPRPRSASLTCCSIGHMTFSRTDGRAMVKLVPAAQLRAARDAKAALAAEKASRKAAAAAAAEQKRLERLEKGRVAPEDMFRTDEFSEWDDAGLPTKDREGNEVNKSRSKKLAKEFAAQKKCVEKSSLPLSLPSLVDEC